MINSCSQVIFASVLALLLIFLVKLKDIKSYQVTAFIISVTLILCAVVVFIPEQGLKIGGVNIKFLTEEEFWHPTEQEKADVDDVAKIDTTMSDQPIEDFSIKHENGSNGDMGAPNGGAITEETSTEFLMSETGIENLHKFFVTLNSAALNKKKISILHYGDSQIEGDRMTGYIRQKIQTQFGGNGPGLIPATNVYNTIAFKQSYSENFERFTCFGGSKLSDSNYGAMASASRFTPEYIIDSTVVLDTLIEQTAWIEIERSKSAYSRAREYNNVNLHYNSCIAPTSLKVYESGTLIHEEDLIADGAQHVFNLNFPSTPGPLKYEFAGKISPNICGFSLEGDYGVQVSNIAMRGSSGTVFRKMKQDGLKSMYDALNVKLIIMQFGGNSVPSFTDSAGVEGYARYFKSQINKVKSLNPDAMVIVIGPSDMSVAEEGIYTTYPFLPYCVERMREETKAAGGAYWNLFAAMGGENSMPSWVEEGWAGKDYIHFSNAGTKIASQMFYEALIAQFARWKNAQIE